MAAKRKQSFAEIVAQVRATPPTPIVVRPGTFNADGQLFDPSGTLLTRAQDSITEAEAADLVVAGALAVFEACGCGGGGGCIPEWIDADGLNRLRTADKPRFVRATARQRGSTTGPVPPARWYSCTATSSGAACSSEA